MELGDIDIQDKAKGDPFGLVERAVNSISTFFGGAGTGASDDRAKHVLNNMIKSVWLKTLADRGLSK